jgi:hypothetical protein
VSKVEYDDYRVEARARLIWQLAGLQSSTSPNYELADRLRRENERDFPILSPGDRERLESVVKRATST